MTDRTKAPLIHDFVFLPPLNPHRHTLDNGIQCLLLPNAHLAIVQMIVQIKAGAFYQEKLGVATACLKMLREGTASLSSAEIAEQLDYIGSYLICNAGKDYVSLHIYFPPKATRQVMCLLADLLKNPTFPQQQLDIYKQNLKNELAVEFEKTSYKARCCFMETIFDQHPYGRILHIDDIDHIHRSDLEAFFQQYYHAKNIKIFAAGQIDNSFVENVEEYFGDIVGKTNAEPTLITHIPQAEKKYFEKQDAVQSSIFIGQRSITKQDPDWPVFSLASLVLGGYFGSRLMKNIREDKGLAYHIYANLHTFVHAGMFYVAADVNKSQVQESVGQIYHEMEVLQTALMSKEELTLVKNYLYGSLMKCFDGVFAQLDLLLETEKHNLPLAFWANYVECIKTMTADDLLAGAARMLDMDNMTEIIVG